MRGNAGLNNIWPKLDVGLRRIIEVADKKGEGDSDGISMEYWMEMYTSVHDYCAQSGSSSHQPMVFGGSRAGVRGRGGNTPFKGQSLYNAVMKLMEEAARERLQLLHGVNGDSLLAEYRRSWDSWTLSMGKIDKVLQYLNRHWIRREAEDGRGETYEIHTLSLVVWRDRVFRESRGSLIAATLDTIRRDRDGEAIDISTLKSVLESFVTLGINRDKPKECTLSEYRHFEQEFLLATELYYVQEATKFLAENSVTDYLYKMETRMDEEVKRVEQYLHQETLTPLNKKIDQVLVASAQDVLLSEFSNLMRDFRIDDLKRLYRALSRIEGGIDPMKQSMEAIIRDYGEKSIAAIADRVQNDPREYVNCLLGTFHKYNGLIRAAFNSDHRFEEALDRACRQFMNKNQLSEKHDSRSIGAEFLARYADQILKKSGEKLEESQRESCLDDVMVVFKYIEEKDAFMAFFTKQLASRLINGTSVSDHLEGVMIQKLKTVCGFEHTSGLKSMFNDMKVSKDLQEQFQSSVTSRNKDMAVDFSALVLAKGIWPVKEGTTEFNMPGALRSCKELFEEFYSQRHSSRRLTWVFNMSKGEVKLNYTQKHKYILQCSTYQIGVLEQFNRSRILSQAKLATLLGLTEDVLNVTLKSLVRTKVLSVRPALTKAKPAITPTHEFCLNGKFESRSIRMNVNIKMGQEQKREVGETQKQIQEGRTLEIQACIVRIMKARKQLDHRLLVPEVTTQLKKRFEPNIGHIKRCIDMLIEKEYLERVEGKSSTYSYIT